MRSPEEGIHLCSKHDMREFGWNVLGLTGEGNGNPPQYSCLENPMTEVPDGLTVHGVTKESDMTEATEH